MSFLKNKFVVIIIIAILAGGVVGFYLSGMKKSVTPIHPSSSGATTEKVGEVMKKLNDLTNE